MLQINMFYYQNVDLNIAFRLIKLWDHLYTLWVSQVTLFPLVIKSAEITL